MRRFLQIESFKELFLHQTFNFIYVLKTGGRIRKNIHFLSTSNKTRNSQLLIWTVTSQQATKLSCLFPVFILGRQIFKCKSALHYLVIVQTFIYRLLTALDAFQSFHYLKQRREVNLANLSVVFSPGELQVKICYCALLNTQQRQRIFS